MLRKKIQKGNTDISAQCDIYIYIYIYPRKTSH